MGADYKHAQRSQISLGGSTNVPGNATNYFGLGQSAGAQISAIPISVNGVIRNFYAASSVPAGVGETYTYTVMVNGLATAITCNHGGAVDQMSSDLVNAVALVPGDLLEIRLVATLNAPNARHQASLENDI